MLQKLPVIVAYVVEINNSCWVLAGVAHNLSSMLLSNAYSTHAYASAMFFPRVFLAKKALPCAFPLARIMLRVYLIRMLTK